MNENKKWKVQHRWDTAANWRLLNPVLLAGEKGIVSDSPSEKREYRVGDGTTHWNDLPASFDWDGKMPEVPAQKIPTKLSELEADVQSQHFTKEEKNKLASIVPGEGGMPSVATNYGDLAGKPQIDGHEFKSGNQTAESLGLLASSDADKIKDDVLFGTENFVKITLPIIKGQYVNYSGGLEKTPSFSMTEPITLNAGTQICYTAKGYMKNGKGVVSMISEKVKGCKTPYKPLVIADSLEAKEYRFLIVRKMDVVFTFVESAPHEISLSYKSLNEVRQIYDPQIANISEFIRIQKTEAATKETGHYISVNGDRGAYDTSSGFKMMNPITLLPNQTIKVTTEGYKGKVAIFSSLLPNGKYHVYVSDNGAEKAYRYSFTNMSNNALDIIISGKDTISDEEMNVTITELDIPNLEKYITTGIDNCITSLNPLEVIKESDGLCYMFRDWGFIGDSYLSGVLDNEQPSDYGYTVDFKSNWGQVICRRLGVTGTNWSTGGITTPQWVETFGKDVQSGTNTNGERKILSEDLKNIYINGLGINDTGKGTVLGAISDIKEDFNTNGITFYGQYDWIIRKIKTLKSDALIFCYTVPELFAPSVEKNGYNKAIRDICEKYKGQGVFLMDMQKYLPNNPQILSLYKKGAHLTIAGYVWFSFAVTTYIDYLVKNNPEEFNLYRSGDGQQSN